MPLDRRAHDRPAALWRPVQTKPSRRHTLGVAGSAGSCHSGSGRLPGHPGAKGHKGVIWMDHAYLSLWYKIETYQDWRQAGPVKKKGVAG